MWRCKADTSILVVEHGCILEMHYGTEHEVNGPEREQLQNME